MHSGTTCIPHSALKFEHLCLHIRKILTLNSEELPKKSFRSPSCGLLPCARHGPSGAWPCHLPWVQRVQELVVSLSIPGFAFVKGLPAARCPRVHALPLGPSAPGAAGRGQRCCPPRLRSGGVWPHCRQQVLRVSESFCGSTWTWWLGSFSASGCLPQQRHIGDGGQLVWAALLSRKRRHPSVLWRRAGKGRVVT